MNLVGLFFPYNMKLRNFFFQFPKLQEHPVNITSLRELNLIIEHRFQQRCMDQPLSSQPLSCFCLCQTCHRHDTSRRCLLHHLIPGSGIDAHLIRLFLPGIFSLSVQDCFYFQAPSCDLHPGQTVSLLVTADFKDTGTEFFRILGASGEFPQTLQKFLHTVQLQRRTKKTGENLPFQNQGENLILGETSVFQITFQRVFAAHGNILIKLIRTLFPEIHTPLVQAAVQFLHQCTPVCSRLIHLVDKQKDRDFVLCKQTPQRFYMSLDTVGAADDQYRIIQHLQRPLHLRGKIHMARRVQKRVLRFSEREFRLLGEDRNSSCPLQFIGVQKRVPVIHTAQLPDRSGQIENTLRKRRLSGIHVRQKTDIDMIGRLESLLFLSVIRRIFHENTPFCAIIIQI